MKAGHRLKAGDLRDRLLQTHCFSKEMAKSKEKDLPKFVELANHWTELESRQKVIPSRSFNRRREEVGEQRKPENIHVPVTSELGIS